MVVVVVVMVSQALLSKTWRREPGMAEYFETEVQAALEQRLEATQE